MKSKKNKTIPTIEEIEMQIHHQVADTIAFCINKQKTSIFRVEKVLQTYISDLACLFFQLFIMSFHDRMDYSKWLSSGLYYKGALIGRTIKTIYGEVRYWRSYLIRKNKSGGFYPLDAEIGLTKDGFTPLVLNLATKLATRVSFGVSVTIFRCFYGWSPSTEAVEHLVLGMGRNASAYMEQVNNLAEEEGDVLVIEVDGKATPTATEAELEKRRGKRKKLLPASQRKEQT